MKQCCLRLAHRLRRRTNIKTALAQHLWESREVVSRTSVHNELREFHLSPHNLTYRVWRKRPVSPSQNDGLYKTHDESLLCFQKAGAFHPSKHETLTQCLIEVGPPSALGQPQLNIGSTSCVFWDIY